MTNDEAFMLTVRENKNALIPWYLTASWAYYWLDDPILSDVLYDSLCRQLLTEWESVDHYHKHLIDKSWLEAGTCLLSKPLYPERVKSAVEFRLLNPGWF